MFAKMIRYYGFGHQELMDMPCDWFMIYYRAITTIEAQEELLGMQRVTTPHMKENARKKLHSKYSKLAYDHEEKEFISPTELAKQLGAING